MAARILITDDDPEQRSLSRYFLEHRGYEIDECVNGAEAVERLSKEHFDLLVLDLLMPIQDGFTTLQQLRSQDFGKDIPIIVLSSLAQEANVVRALQLGATDFLRKPFSPEELYFRVARFVPNKS